EQTSVSRAAAGAGGDVHHYRADRVRGRAQHSDLADHDGHGEDERYCRAPVAGDEEETDTARVHRTGRADWRNWNRHRAGARLCDLMGGRTLSLHFALARGVF